MAREEARALFARNTSAFLRAVHALMTSDSLRRSFDADPGAMLAHLGFEFVDEAQMEEVTKGIREIQTIPDPGGDVMNVAVGVAAGTRPAVSIGTQPVVAVAVSVASQGEAEEVMTNPNPERLFKVNEARLMDQVRIAQLENEIEDLKLRVEELAGGGQRRC